MKVKARSIFGKTFIRTLAWTAAVIVLNLVIFLVFGDCKFAVSAISISIIALGFKVINLVHITFLALCDDEVDIAADKDSRNATETIPSEQNGTGLACPECGQSYNIADYRDDIDNIFCSGCRTKIPRIRADGEQGRVRSSK